MGVLCAFPTSMQVLIASGSRTRSFPPGYSFSALSGFLVLQQIYTWSASSFFISQLLFFYSTLGFVNFINFMVW